VWSSEYNGIYFVPGALEMFARAFMSEKIALTSGTAYSGATCRTEGNTNDCGICTGNQLHVYVVVCTVSIAF
jgi:hypothetical protein